jgi:hypothetical protein
MTAATLLRTALLLAVVAAPVQAQQTAFLVGRGNAAVRVTAGVTMPEILQLRQTAQPAATWQGADYTEYLLKFDVGTNVAWALVADALPEGVTILDEAGRWSAAGAVALGQPTNRTETLVRVRVADGAAITWAQDLQLELRRTY